MATIQVLGTGCSRCGHLLKNAEEAVSQLNGNDSVEKVDDIVRILEFTPSALPALAIDGTVVFTGLPSVTEICEAIQATSASKESKP